EWSRASSISPFGSGGSQRRSSPVPPPQRSSGWRAVRTAVDDSVFHDEADVPEGVDVLQRVAVDRDEVGALAGGQGAHFRVDAAGLGAAARTRDQRVARGAPQPDPR